ncbi:translation initiation factor IF3 [Aspergillus karnatakaensis]|uniref:putative translation initiation factor IF3 n=1 Tax=Aspergillus karnatakaensis TaxID=1810916 RepID=UPI003CCD9BC8
MKHIRGLLSSTQALRQVFLGPQPVPRTQFFCYAPTQPRLQVRFNSRGFLAQNQITTNNHIQAEYVQIVNADNKLDPPVRLRDVLRTINRPDETLLQVSPGSYDKPAVCKIVSTTAVRQQALQKSKVEKAVKAAKASVKTIELNWAIDAHDLNHRLKQLLGFLDKGRAVEIILKRKKGKRIPTVEEIKALMDKVLQTVKDADAVQIEPMEGMPGKQVTLLVKKRTA